VKRSATGFNPSKKPILERTPMRPMGQDMAMHDSPDDRRRRERRIKERVQQRLARELGKFGLGDRSPRRLVGKLARSPRPGRARRSHNLRHLEGEPTRQETRSDEEWRKRDKHQQLALDLSLFRPAKISSTPCNTAAPRPYVRSNVAERSIKNTRIGRKQS
jgi:hypothetical protein